MCLIRTNIVGSQVQDIFKMLFSMDYQGQLEMHNNNGKDSHEPLSVISKVEME